MRGQKIAVMLCMLCSVAVVACSNADTQDSVQTQVPQGRVVGISTISKQPLTTNYTLSGTLEAESQMSAAFEVPGRIVETNVQIGDAVKKGNILAKLDTYQYRLQLDQAIQGAAQAKAALDSAEAAIHVSTAQVKRTEANLQEVKKGARTQQRERLKNAVTLAQAACEKAQLDAERSQRLYEQGLVSQSDNESAQLALTNAQNVVKDTESALSEMQAGATKEQIRAASGMLDEANSGKMASIAAKKQAVAAYNAALAVKRQAELALSKTALHSRFDGVVLTKSFHNGELAAEGQSVYTLGNVDELKVLLPLPDREVKLWKPGTAVDVSLYGQTIKGTVNKIYPITNAATGTINGEVVINNEQLGWSPGQVVKVGLHRAGRDVILVPVEAVIRDGEKPFVYKVKNGVAAKTIVQLGEHTVNNRFEISGGLQVGDQIVTKGAELLFDGDHVHAAKGAAQ
ncbi:efflux RND transporter periplasmic adaptor subunit [Paenibacillus sp. UMB4589-SE434]|uniref:efflux RND transporter periplasmic adaptor subunit n=1 Tax=Paenibacillus sp. UMB4589-SE434 TaxID=3046314 RepID=UPI00254E9A58|nr:efflux RND transporter periplasmic adaptor subunit [Paenibacillus sp. UMB4589-SE434]MDK8180262.1 efflux RND transporter periplasmic adaptor subunit [Paenibacillus sp. UMB4589-SE434]